MEYPVTYCCRRKQDRAEPLSMSTKDDSIPYLEDFLDLLFMKGELRKRGNQS